MLYITVRAAMDPHTLTSALRAQVVAVNRGQPITDVQTMQERLDAASAQTRSMMLLIGRILRRLRCCSRSSESTA